MCELEDRLGGARRIWARANLPAIAMLGTLACSGSGSNSVVGSTGGSPIATGGSAANGGTSAAIVGGTSSASGGSAAVGGSVQGTNTAAGGIAQTGGNGSTGGTTAIGGTKAAGGSSSTGGTTAMGGTKAIGGSLSTGGTKAPGGTSASGGTKATGGISSTGSTSVAGGTKATGGSLSTGGTKAAGGTSASGGTAVNSTTPITIWMAGDSTMQKCSSTTCQCGWGSQFAAYFNSNVTVVNSAVGGRSIQTWLYEGAVSGTMSGDDCVMSSTTYDARWTSMLSSMKTGDYLFIAFGINDGDNTCPRHVSPGRYQTLLGVMADAAKAKGAFPIFLTPTDAIVCSGSTVTENRGFLTDTKAAATAASVPMIDLNQLSMSLYSSLGFCPNSGDYTSTTSALGKFFCDDHTHFEAAGAKQIAGLVATALRTQGIALASYLL